MNMNMITRIQDILSCWPALFAGLLLFSACDNNAPLDADTRQKIDSTIVAQNKLILTEVDSLCKVQHKTLLPLLIDSIKKERMREIDRQLKTIPK
jgi:hypothetical protein